MFRYERRTYKDGKCQDIAICSMRPEEYGDAVLTRRGALELVNEWNRQYDAAERKGIIYIYQLL